VTVLPDVSRRGNIRVMREPPLRPLAAQIRTATFGAMPATALAVSLRKDTSALTALSRGTE